jgi:hypothetical protein
MPWRKKEIVTTYIFQGLKRDLALSIAGISKHQYYYRPTNRIKGRKSTETTLKKDGDNIERCPNNIVIGDIKVDIPVILTPHSGDIDPSFR